MGDNKDKTNSEMESSETTDNTAVGKDVKKTEEEVLTNGHAEEEEDRPSSVIENGIGETSAEGSEMNTAEEDSSQDTEKEFQKNEATEGDEDAHEEADAGESEPLTAEEPSEPVATNDPQQETKENSASPEVQPSGNSQPDDHPTPEAVVSEDKEHSDERIEEVQPLTLANPDNTDVESGQAATEKSENNSAITRRKTEILRLLKKREILFCFIGGTAFLIGLIMIIVGLMVMQGKCDRYKDPEYDGENHQLFNTALGGDDHHHVTYIHKHEHELNFTEETTMNLAEGRLAFQSSTYIQDAVHFNASLAVDGNISDRFKKGACAQTEYQERPFWYVDLGEAHSIKRVKILGPGDCCLGELHDFEIRVGDDGDLKKNELCKHFMGTALRVSINIHCDQQLFGQYVSIHMLGDDNRRRDRLTVCEVSVFSG